MDKLQGDLNLIKQKVMTNEKDTADLIALIDHNAADTTDIMEEMLLEINTAWKDSMDRLKKEIMCQELHDKKSNMIFHSIDFVGGK